LALDAVKWRVPLHGLAHVGHIAHDERVEALPNVALPAGYRGDVRLNRSIAVRLRDLRVAAREEDGDLLAFSHLDRLGLPRPWLGLRACFRRGLGLDGRLAWLAHAMCPLDRRFSATAAWIKALNASASSTSPSRISMARRVFPSRLELKSPRGSSKEAPRAKVSLTICL